VCDDGNPCTHDQCASNGTCLYSPVLCDISDPCNPHYCNGGQCVLQKVQCNDNNMCTNDSCVNNQGVAQCVFAPVTTCSNDSCTPTVCNKNTGRCDAIPKNCDDGSPCTDDAIICVNNALACNYTLNGMCDDNNTCTNDYCSSVNASQPCSYINITCPLPSVCQTSLGCDHVNGCQYTDKICPASKSLCQIAACDPVAGCIFNNKVCVVDDVNCFVGTCDDSTGVCSKARKGNFNTATSTNGQTCLWRYDKKTQAIVIGAGAAAGIAIGAAAAVGLLGYGGKKGYELYKNHANMKNAPVQDNPLYEATNANSDNPLYRYSTSAT